jgi:hypothetical protein
MLRDN